MTGDLPKKRRPRESTTWWLSGWDLEDLGFDTVTWPLRGSVKVGGLDGPGLGVIPGAFKGSMKTGKWNTSPKYSIFLECFLDRRWWRFSRAFDKGPKSLQDRSAQRVVMESCKEGSSVAKNAHACLMRERENCRVRSFQTEQKATRASDVAWTEGGRRRENPLGMHPASRAREIKFTLAL